MNVSRRRTLKVGLLGGTALLVSVAVVRTRGYVLPQGLVPKNMPLSAACILLAVAERILAPDEPSAPTPREMPFVSLVDASLATLPTEMRTDLVRFLALVEQAAPLLVGKVRRFTRLSPDQQDEVLKALEGSRHTLLRAGFQGVKSLVMMAYYSHPSTWAILGYEGPRA